MKRRVACREKIASPVINFLVAPSTSSIASDLGHVSLTGNRIWIFCWYPDIWEWDGGYFSVSSRVTARTSVMWMWLNAGFCPNDPIWILGIESATPIAIFRSHNCYNRCSIFKFKPTRRLQRGLYRFWPHTNDRVSQSGFSRDVDIRCLCLVMLIHCVGMSQSLCELGRRPVVWSLNRNPATSDFSVLKGIPVNSKNLIAHFAK